MINRNSASLHEIVAAGVDPVAPRAMALWGPFRSWEDLLWIGEVDDATMASVRSSGFEIEGTTNHNWPAPKAFQVSASHAA